MKPNLQGILDALSPRSLSTLEVFGQLLAERAVALGLISSSDRARLWERHVLDSVRGVSCLPEETHSVADIGSGAGLPGIPVAICRPDLAMHLVEARSRRAAFLELVIERLHLPNVRVHAEAAERMDLTVDLCLARAVAAPAKSWRLARWMLPSDGRLLLWAGRTWPGRGGADLDRLAVRWKICAAPGFSWQGPLVIIGGT